MESHMNVSWKRHIGDVSYINVWELEKSVDFDSWRTWLSQNHMTINYVAALYILLAFGGQYLMKDRKSFSVRSEFTVWNFLLAGFSFIGLMRTSPELFHILKQDSGFFNSVCGREYNAATVFWAFLMTASKFVELGDTVFIVLMKKPLTFLNWGHHSIALVGGCQLFYSVPPMGRWFMVMNFFVHSIMYSYFGFRTLNISVPRVVPQLITTFQTLQMLIGSFIGYYVLYMKFNGVDCYESTTGAIVHTILYTMFFGLFSKYFINAYILPKVQNGNRKPKTE